MMGLGCARRALVESICYATARDAFDRRLIDHPLMRRKLAELIVDVEAAQALVFDYGGVANCRRTSAVTRLRLAPAVIKLQAARLGITAASDAIEVHGGNGYIEDWPVARILRDAQANTIWEGADNILCLDIRRAIERQAADLPFLERLREGLRNAGETVTARRVAEHVDALEGAIGDWKALSARDRESGEAALFELGGAIGRVYAAVLLVEQATWEREELGDERKDLVARLFVDRHLEPGRWRRVAVEGEPGAGRDFDRLLNGAFRA
jgi:hypothetical protein